MSFDPRPMLATLTAPELADLAPIARVVAKRYTASVGPWRADSAVPDR
jgi:hypothetical protein